MRKLLTHIVISLLVLSCKPNFNLAKEEPFINGLASGELSKEDYLEKIPNVFKDSIPKEKAYKYLDSIQNLFNSIFFKPKDIISQNIQITKLSSTKKINGFYFKIIEYSNSIKIHKNEGNVYLYDLKAFLDENLINYADDVTKLISPLSTTLDNNLLAYWEKETKTWKYLAYNDLYNESLFGLEIAQKLIDLYFSDIFIPAKTEWDEESVDIFKELYEEERKTYEEDGIDFNKFLKCRIKYQEKLEEDFNNNNIPDTYYESLYFIDSSIKCRIYSKNYKTKHGI